MIMGVAARLAIRMGYHRDPRHLSSISPFEGEMRRRTFFTVQMFDLLLAFQAGLPAIIHEDECDIEPPKNLLDADFDEFLPQFPHLDRRQIRRRYCFFVTKVAWQEFWDELCAIRFPSSLHHVGYLFWALLLQSIVLGFLPCDLQQRTV